MGRRRSRAIILGMITREVGGTVRIVILLGRASYAGSIRNGVVSGDHGAWAGSYSVVAACRGEGCAPSP